MISLMLTTDNQREARVLEMAFKQQGFEIMLFKPSYQNYVKLLQYLPDILIIDIPRMGGDQIQFIKLIRSHKQTKSLPVIGYGDRVDAGIKKGFFQSGLSDYLERPLQFASVMRIIETNLKKISKSIDGLNKQPTATDRDADITALVSPDTLPMKKIEIMASHTKRFLAFPFTVAKVLKLTQDEKSGAGDLAKVIETDPVISANMLKVSNTVFFASLNRRIGSIKDAVVRIGFAETKRIVVSMSVMDLFEKENRHAGFCREDFWYHSLACAIIAEHLARRMDGVNSEETFLAGLLHDFGIIILDEFFGEIFAQALEETANCGGLFITSEMRLLGINHNDVVKELYSSWKIPEAISEAVIGQYDYRSLENKLDSPGKKMALCVGVANILAKALCIGRECDRFVGPIDNWIMRLYKFPGGLRQQFLDNVYSDIELYRKFLGLEERNFSKTFDGIDRPEEKKIGFVNISGDVFAPAVVYLARQGIEITPVNTKEKLSAVDGIFDAVLTSAAPDTIAGSIDRYSGIVKRGSRADGAALPEMAPQLVFIDDNSPLRGSNDFDKISLMPRSFDLRKLEENIMEMLMGKTVAFASYSGPVEDIKVPPAQPPQARPHIQGKPQ